MPEIRRIGTSLPAAAVASAAFVLLAGVSAWSVSLALLLPLLLRSGLPDRPAGLTAAVVAAVAAATGGGPTGEALVAVSSLVALTGSDSRVRRLLLTAPIALLLPAGWPYVLVLLTAASAAALMSMPTLRWAMITAGAAVCLALNGLPGSDPGAGPITARAIAHGAGAVWPDTVALDHSQPVLELDFSRVAGQEVQLRASAGGMRRREPVGRLELPDGSVSFILHGDTILTFAAPDGHARLMMSAGWSPFNHPVLRFCGASADGGSP
jgi:hypothetical protein